jgi:hypothetical protein
MLKAETGTTPTQYLRSLRMQHARELLETTFFSVKEITNLVGLRSESHLVTDFRRDYGFTPAQYRAARMSIVGLHKDQQMLDSHFGEGNLRWNLLTEYVGQQTTQKDFGQVTFRVQAGNREAPINTIDVTVGGTREPGLLDINNPNCRRFEYQTCRVLLYKVN